MGVCRFAEYKYKRGYTTPIDGWRRSTERTTNDSLTPYHHLLLSILLLHLRLQSALIPHTKSSHIPAQARPRDLLSSYAPLTALPPRTCLIAIHAAPSAISAPHAPRRVLQRRDLRAARLRPAHREPLGEEDHRERVPCSLRS